MKQNFFDAREQKAIDSVGSTLGKLPDFCYDFFIGVESRTSALTRKNYAVDLFIFFEYLSIRLEKPITDISLADLNTLSAIHIEGFLSYLNYYSRGGKTRKNGEKGKARKLATLRSFFKFFFNKDKLVSNVASKVETPKIHQKEIIRLETDEVVSIINQAEDASGLSLRAQAFNKRTNKRDVALLTLFLGTGIRISECVGLDIADFDFKQNAFQVTRKGGNQTVLYFSDEVANAIKIWLDHRSAMNLPADEKAVFVSLQNKRISIRAVENLVKKYAFVVNPLKKISPHKLRSTYGTNLYRETGDIYIVADVLGHKDVNTTKKHYAAISNDMRRRVAGKVVLRNSEENNE